ncbi:MAG: protein kinase, partial [Lachnospiraceae bacterium]|nr:protein kinase [Lachnospiraceae bacterium]
RYPYRYRPGAVLEYLHGRGIIHRDIKPSNLIMADDGHIRLIDFDAARMPKAEQEQDTHLLGTRGYAAPEQYGFAQTDERTDIYSLGITLERLLGENFQRPRYRKILHKCSDLDPNKRYQSVREVQEAFFQKKQKRICGCAVACVLAVIFGAVLYQANIFQGESTELSVLPMPEDPHWDGDTGIMLWGNVPESGYGDGVQYFWKLYRKDTAETPQPGEEGWCAEGDMRGDNAPREWYEMNFSQFFEENGFYYVAVAAAGDGIVYTDSPYVVSDVFEYTGADAPMLPAPTDLSWKIVEEEADGVSERTYWATWGNIDEYVDSDSFDVCVYDQDGNYVMNNIWRKDWILEVGNGGIRIRKEFLSDRNGSYRFTVQALTSRPNDFKNSPMPEPVPEEYFSPWYSN